MSLQGQSYLICLKDCITPHMSQTDTYTQMYVLIPSSNEEFSSSTPKQLPTGTLGQEQPS